MEKGKSCGGCHDSKTAFAVTGSCEKCHKPVAIKYEFPSKMSVKSVIFSHKLHLGKGYNCSDCHYKIYAAGAGRRSFTMQEMNEGKSCGACHGMAMAFSVRQSDKCVRCHLDESDGGQQTPSPQN
jgi:c(7)-type cytochrome triheme protein